MKNKVKKTALIVYSLFCAMNYFAQKDTVLIGAFGSVKNKQIRNELRSISIETEMEGVKMKSQGLTPLKKFKKTKNKIALFNDTLKVEISSRKFDSKKHKLKCRTKDGFTWLDKIDGRSFYGTDGGVPAEQIQSLKIILKSDTLVLSEKYTADLFQPSLYVETRYGQKNYPCAVFISKDKKRIFVQMQNSDGAGSYEVIWILENKHLIYRFVSHSC